MKNKILSVLLTLAIIASAFAGIGVVDVSAASAYTYEKLTIKGSTLNASTVYGRGDSSFTMDADGGFFSTYKQSSGALPDNGLITTSKDNIPYKLTWTGSYPYSGNDSIRLKGTRSGGYVTSSKYTMTLLSYGAYDKIYILGTAGGFADNTKSLNFSVQLTYTDGTVSTTQYSLYDWYKPYSYVEGYKIYKRLNKNGSTIDQDYGTNGGPMLQSKAVECDETKLLKSISFQISNTLANVANENGIYAAIYAVTGAIKNDAPTTPVINNAQNVTTYGFMANWNKVDKAAEYYLDVSEYPDFNNNGSESFLGIYNNYKISGETNYCQISGLDRNTTYYYRVRAKNAYGQSASSAVKATTTHKCDVYYNDNGGSNGPGMLDLASDWTLQTPVSVPTRTGYVFNGYYTALINGKQYYNASGVRTNTSSFEDYTMNLYAQWTIKESTLTIDANGGKYSGDTTITDSYGNSIKIDDPTNSNAEKVFLRWEPSNDNCTIVDGAGYTTYIFGAETTAVTLKAIWYSPEQISTEINSTQTSTKVENLESLYEYTADGEENGLTSQDFEASSLVVKAIVNDMSEEDSLDEFIEETATHEALKYYDISLVKIVDGVKTNLTEIEKPITITIPITGDIHGKTGYTVYRIHNGVKEKMTSSRTSPEFYEVKDGNIVIHTKKFSTYAIATSQSVIGVLDESQINDTNNYASTDVQTKYTDGSNKAIYKIDVEWGAMQFTFNKHQKWDPENHQYSSDIRIELDESAYVDGNNKIVVTNHSNADVRVSMVLVDKDIDGVEMALYTTNSAESSLAENMELAKVSDATGSGTVDSTNAYLRFDDGMINSDGLEKLIQNPNVFQTVATIMVTVEPVEGSVLTPKIS